ncbi:MAG: aminoacyl-tRNA hydrolase [Candidatus Thiodiazotropha sp. (ex. Lucinisca nassula)]|nr:aminoacyl-tRNA hydrolase [Candidatus Thiodiazotropha sp. (ex. Lucinisca nassula)]MBW9274851.1 aminoacyl-tRNA hydrolase [Candidatus Thiodiazotropha sp. (ex. Lucinisca nassula)]PUB73106.1 MAG: aminoacyl-tRNA hydrolase [gamma proteobacterium symbiont of Ctena orbiculata]PUB84041.1 MAG: aminoacyl-tRNA hydrolase [gamma proteobacterium symbiont of Ctena orbiculata]
MTLAISRNVTIPDSEIEISAVRSQGSGGQNVNKVASAIHLRFDITASSLPERYRQRLLKLSDKRISKDGVVIIKAQRYRDQERNRQDALDRLQRLIARVLAKPKKRIPTKPTKASNRRRLDSKTKRGRQKALRRRVED